MVLGKASKCSLCDIQIQILPLYSNLCYISQLDTYDLFLGDNGKPPTECSMIEKNSITIQQPEHTITLPSHSLIRD